MNYINTRTRAITLPSGAAAIELYGKRASREEIETGEDLGGRSEMLVATVNAEFASDIYGDTVGNEWFDTGGDSVLLKPGVDDAIRALAEI